VVEVLIASLERTERMIEVNRQREIQARLTRQAQMEV